jgi:hypothetical protein
VGLHGGTGQIKRPGDRWDSIVYRLRAGIAAGIHGNRRRPRAFGPIYALNGTRCMSFSRMDGLRLKFFSWWNSFRLRSSNPVVRSKALDSLSGSTNSRDTERVLASLHDESPHVRCVALRALAKKGHRPETLKSLVNALGDPSAEVREVAARVLARLGNASIADSLVACLKDPESSVRGAAASALRAIGWRPSTHEEAARFDIALGNTPDPVAAALPPAQTSAESNTTFSRRIQAEMLKERNDPARISALLTAAFGNNLLARVSAIHDLGQVTGPAVSQALPRLLRDPEPEARLAAAQALAHRDDTLPAHFVGLLQDSSAEVRLVAVRFFARVPNHQVTHILLPLLADPVANVRQATATTIGFDGNSAAIEDLVVALMDEDIQVRHAAQESLVRIDQNWWCSAGAAAAGRRLQTLLTICPTADLERLSQLLEAIGGRESHAEHQLSA